MKQTAVEWLVEYLTLHGVNLNNGALHNVINQAKEMEKEQIIEAFENGEVCTMFKNEGTSRQYYNETYKQDEQNQ